MWRGKNFEVEEVISSRRVLDSKRSWWRRRHRDYYRVRTREGRIFDPYLHHGPGRRYWVLLRKSPTDDPGFERRRKGPPRSDEAQSWEPLVGKSAVTKIYSVDLRVPGVVNTTATSAPAGIGGVFTSPMR